MRESRTYSLADLVGAVVEGRSATGTTEYDEWCRQRAHALVGAFAQNARGELGFLLKPELDPEGFGSLFESGVSALVDARSPFSDYLEAPEAVSGLGQRFGAHLREAAEALAREIQGLLVALVIEAGSLVGDETVTSQDLARQGWDEPAPPDDGLDDW